MTEPLIERVDDIHHYQITVDGQVAGYLNYRAHGERMVFLRTEIDTAFAGQGLGDALVSGALADALGTGTRIIPLCPTVAAYLVKHHDYDEIVDSPQLLDGPPAQLNGRLITFKKK
jgi:uncharacterized protein